METCDFLAGGQGGFDFLVAALSPFLRVAGRGGLLAEMQQQILAVNLVDTCC